MGSPGSSSSSEDGDEEWKAAISSITASADAASTISNGSNQAGVPDRSVPSDEDDDPNHHHRIKARLPKHYQIKAQKLLDEIVERNLEIVRDAPDVPDNDAVPDEGGIRLFKNAPVGIVFDRVDEPKGPKKKPRILPREEINEKSKKFKRQLKSVAVEGFDVIAIAKAASEKSLARLQAKEARAKAAAKKEEERVAELKRIRGERWLPSIAKEMQPKPQVKRMVN